MSLYGNTTGVLEQGLVGLPLQDIVAGIMLAAAPVLLFYGSKCFRGLLAVIGFTGGLYSSMSITAITGSTISSDLTAVVAIGFGVFGALALYSLYKVGLFFVGAIGGLVAGTFVLKNIVAAGWSGSIGVQISVLVILMLLGGFATIRYRHGVIATFTSFLGGFSLVSGIDHFRHGPLALEAFGLFDGNGGFSDHLRDFQCSEDRICYVLLSTWVVSFVVGVIFQRRLWCCKKREPLVDEEMNPLPRREPSDPTMRSWRAFRHGRSARFQRIREPVSDDTNAYFSSSSGSASDDELSEESIRAILRHLQSRPRSQRKRRRHRARRRSPRRRSDATRSAQIEESPRKRGDEGPVSSEEDSAAGSVSDEVDV